MRWQHLHRPSLRLRSQTGIRDFCFGAADLWCRAMHVGRSPPPRICPFSESHICGTPGVLGIYVWKDACLSACLSLTVSVCAYKHTNNSMVPDVAGKPRSWLHPNSCHLCRGTLFSSVILHTGGANSRSSDKEHEKQALGRDFPDDSPGKSAYFITKKTALIKVETVGSDHVERAPPPTSFYTLLSWGPCFRCFSSSPLSSEVWGVWGYLFSSPF